MEQLPPVEVFAGMDAVRESATEVPGLPTREKLREWMVEHDKIEKETEIFDSGELQKLKKFTKGAYATGLLFVPRSKRVPRQSGRLQEPIGSGHRPHRAYLDDNLHARQADTPPPRPL